MRLRTKKYLEDIRMACEGISQFVTGKTVGDYEKDLMLRSAVERQFIIIGEALNQLAYEDRDTAERITDFREIIGFRNVLVHGYDVADDTVVWDTITKDLPILEKEIVKLLAE
jgi:uncharacterized protein with HEPN domain